MRAQPIHRDRRGVAATVAVTLAALLSLLVAPAHAEPYPPGVPGQPDPSVTCSLRATETTRIAECVGSELKPGSTITVEVILSGTAAAAPRLATTFVLAQDVDQSGTGTVQEDRTGATQTLIGCELDGTVTIRGAGEAPDDADGQPTVTDEIVRDLADFPCGDEDATAAPPGTDRGGLGGLPFTGADLLLLLLIALLLLLTGYGILRSRPRRPAA
ncbi:hypothetical protein FTX61_03920 [Nitriliruptoraceae bacterium ZYF776]|nr:hypothetical protein [Profundirhabdus halotolerans]